MHSSSHPGALKRPILLVTALAFASNAVAQDPCWDAAAPCPTERFEGPSVVVDDQLYVFGGFGNYLLATSSVDVYDPLGDSWTSRANLPGLLTHIGLALDDREVWVAGGFVGDHPGVATDEVWIYHVDQDTWTAGPPLPKPVAAGALVRLDRFLHYFGGLEADRDTNSADHWALDLDDVAAGWFALAPFPNPRCHFSGVELGGQLHAIGGQYRHDTNPQDLDLHHVYDPGTNSWSTRAPLPTPRSHFEPGTTKVDGKLIIVGGRSIPLGLMAMIDVTEYDPLADRWSARPSLPEPRLGPSAKVIGDTLYVTAGATGNLKVYGDTWKQHKDATYAAHMRVNCGAGEYLSPVDGSLWCEDHAFIEGRSFSNPAVPDIAGTQDDLLYLDHRTGSFGKPTQLHYRFPTDPGKYRIVLHMAEILHGATGYGGPSVGQRVMDVFLEGELVAADLDVAAEVGVEAALTLTYDFELDGSAVDLDLIASVGQPMLSALELVRLPDDAFRFHCGGAPNSTGAGAEIEFIGSGSVGANLLRLIAGPVPKGFGLFFYGANQTDVPFGNGRRCIAGPLFRLPAVSIADGTLEYTLDLLNPPKSSGAILAGSTWNFQGWYRDPAAGGAGFNSSTALEMTFTD